MIDCFIAIWQAGENDEFIMADNAFGIFEAHRIRRYNSQNVP